MGDLATSKDVVDLWRPLGVATPAEEDGIYRLIAKASSLLRQAAPWVDARIVRFADTPGDPAGLDPQVVATVVAGIVKRFLINSEGATSTTESIGPYSYTRGFALRGETEVRGQLVVTEADLRALEPASLTRARLGTVLVKARMSPANFFEQEDLPGTSGTPDANISGYL